METLSVSELQVAFPTSHGLVKAVNRVSLVLEEGDIFGLLGESGSGKTVLGSAIMRLLPKEVQLEGEIHYKGKNMLTLDRKTLQAMRGKELGMILQNPGSALNPGLTVGTQIAEVLTQHTGATKKQAKEQTVELLRRVKIAHPEKRVKEYPHQYSGGMKERAVIAMGIASNPDFIIADEPTKGLDTIVKQSIVALLKEVCEGKTMMMITHDLDVAQELCTMVGLMYCGELVEIAPPDTLFEKQLHPYTEGFFASMPSRGLHPIPGYSPSLIHVPEGCRFHERCPHRRERCKQEHPPMLDVGEKRKVRCFLYADHGTSE